MFPSTFHQVHSLYDFRKRVCLTVKQKCVLFLLISNLFDHSIEILPEIGDSDIHYVVQVYV